VALPAFCQTSQDNGQNSSQANELKACGAPEKEVNYVADTDKTKHPMGEQTADKALIYVLRPTMFGNKIQTKLAVDSEWMGVNRGNNYFFFSLAPGQHYFCSEAENLSVLILTVEAGKTYYLQQEIRMGMVKARNELAVMEEEKAKEKLAKLHPSTWTTK
jgi:Protein of unknown function (DUF2846)